MAQHTNITTKKINSRYSSGKYLDIDVIIMTKNGYINATDFCSTHKKQSKRYFELPRSNKIRKAIEKRYDVEIEKQTILIESGESKQLLGKYVHPKLLTDIASWISTDLYFKITDLVENYNVKEKNRLLKEQKQLLGEKDDKIDELTKLVQDIKKDTKKIDKVLKINKSMKKDIKSIVVDRVIHTGKDKDYDHLILIENDTKDEKFKPQYTVLRVMKANIGSTIKKHKKKYPRMDELLNIQCNPNTIILWKCIKNRLISNKQIKTHEFDNHRSGMSFNLYKDCTQEDLIDIFHEEHKKRLKTKSLENESDEDSSGSESDDE